MAEEIYQRNLEKNGIKIGKYEFYNIGATTLHDLQKFGIIPKGNYDKYINRKPDGILIERVNDKVNVIAVIENKDLNKLTSNKQKKDAIEQCNTVCQVLKCPIGIITNNIVNIWINPNDHKKENEYYDEVLGSYRSYNYIYDEDKKPLTEKFFIQSNEELDEDKLHHDTKNTLYYIDRCLTCLNTENSILELTPEVDPIKLAKNVWQDIYVNTGKNPTKCLYNVVELFIFKFLSDLHVLDKSKDFYNLIKKIDEKESDESILEYYAKICRPHIRELFPKGEDGTTIINGTIFVDKNGDPVLSQASLFRTSLEKYKNFGNLRNIKKEFKTKLFETFLKQSHDKSRLGQFFTPRKVVKAVTNMVDFDKLPDYARVCDPFCGVGGFVLEPLNETNIKENYIPSNGKINPKITLLGFDKGFDEEEQRTIILAKANMLIYLSDIIEKNPTITKEYSNIFNDTFHLLSESNLGTLKLKFKDEEKFDVIVTNPPYITSGSSSIKTLIEKEGLSNYYKCNGKGIESLCLEWIINNLKPNGSAYIVIPNSIFDVNGNKTLRDYISKKCIVNGIISLPVKTFFNTPQKTYILSITKKKNDSFKQDTPVFMYLVSNIGEELDITRAEIEGQSDLQNAIELYNVFKGNPKYFQNNEINDLRCKIINIQDIVENDNWIPESYWEKSEKESLGIIETTELLEFDELIDKFNNLSQNISKDIKLLNSQEIKTSIGKYEEVLLTKIFEPVKGKDKYTREYVRNNPGDYPLYSSQTTNNGEFGYINTYDFDEKCLTWTTDGIYAGTLFIRNGKFSMTTHCGALLLKDEYKNSIDINYIYVQLKNELRSYALGVGNKRVTETVIKNVTVKIPVNDDGSYNLDRQIDMANEILNTTNIINKIKNELESISKINLKF